MTFSLSGHLLCATCARRGGGKGNGVFCCTNGAKARQESDRAHHDRCAKSSRKCQKAAFGKVRTATTKAECIYTARTKAKQLCRGLIGHPRCCAAPPASVIFQGPSLGGGGVLGFGFQGDAATLLELRAGLLPGEKASRKCRSAMQGRDDLGVTGQLSTLLQSTSDVLSAAPPSTRAGHGEAGGAYI